MLDRAGRVVGVPRQHRRQAAASSYRAPLVLTCEGVSGKLAQHLGVHRNDKRPLGVAVRRYYTSPKTHDDYLESWLELWDGRPNESNLLPGYGWIFGMGDGTVNAGLGVLNSSAGFQKTDYRGDAHPLARQHARGVGAARAERHRRRPAAPALPMGFNRTPHYLRGLLLVGDSGGSVNPFNGEGIPYAMESGQVRRRGRRPGAGPAGRAEPRAGARRPIPKRMQQRVGRVLPARRRLREADRPARR